LSSRASFREVNCITSFSVPEYNADPAHHADPKHALTRRAPAITLHEAIHTLSAESILPLCLISRAN
jgi:hypothetical protein